MGRRRDTAISDAALPMLPTRVSGPQTHRERHAAGARRRLRRRPGSNSWNGGTPAIIEAVRMLDVMNSVTLTIVNSTTMGSSSGVSFAGKRPASRSAMGAGDSNLRELGRGCAWRCAFVPESHTPGNSEQN